MVEVFVHRHGLLHSRRATGITGTQIGRSLAWTGPNRWRDDRERGVARMGGNRASHSKTAEGRRVHFGTVRNFFLLAG